MLELAPGRLLLARLDLHTEPHGEGPGQVPCLPPPPAPLLCPDPALLLQVKCEHYWPLDAQPCTHGHLQVTLEGEKVMQNWTVRDLKLRHVSPPHPPPQSLPQDIPGSPLPTTPRDHGVPQGSPLPSLQPGPSPPF